MGVPQCSQNTLELSRVQIVYNVSDLCYTSGKPAHQYADWKKLAQYLSVEQSFYADFEVLQNNKYKLTKVRVIDDA